MQELALQWESSNLDKFFHFINFTSIILHLILIGCDFYFLGDMGKAVALSRALGVCAIGLVYGFIRVFEKSRWMGKYRRFHDLKLLSLLIPTGIWLIIYQYFLFFSPLPKYDLYFAGYFLVVGFTSFVIYRFASLHLMYHTTALTMVLGSLWLKQTHSDQLFLLFIFNLICLGICWFLRKEFHNSLWTRFLLLNGVLPARLAKAAVLSGSQDEELFKPHGRFVICICSDWRGFQVLTEKHTAQEVSQMLEKFYDEVLFELQLTAPSGNYFLNWTADEIFLVFFHPEDDRSQILRESSAFLEGLMYRVSRTMSSEFQNEVVFDVGVSAGIGLLGLLGPQSMKKTTVAGNVAGLAKRYQEEAKILRQYHPQTPYPFLVVDPVLMEFAPFQDHFPTALFQETKATVKNIAGKQVFWWHEGKSSWYPKGNVS